MNPGSDIKLQNYSLQLNDLYLNELAFKFNEAGTDLLIKSLTLKEKAILICIAEGKQNKQISDELYNSPRTINTHKTNIQRKCGFESSYQLYIFAYINKDKIKLSIK